MAESFQPRSTPDYDGRERGRLWGYFPSQEEKLKLAERRAGYSFFQLHSYKSDMKLPQVPTAMPASLLPPELEHCKPQFDKLDRCVERGLERAKRRESNKYARLYGCKGEWVTFKKCTRFRDGKIMKAILTWESRHLNELPMDEQVKYTNELRAKHRYLEYLSMRTGDKVEQLECNREKTDLERRISSLAALAERQIAGSAAATSQ